MDRLAAVMLARAGRLHLPAGEAVDDGFVDHLEIDLAERGWLLDPAARSGLAALGGAQRTAWADWLLAAVDADSGADRNHVPLFRGFPHSTPVDTTELFIRRVLSFLIQEPDQPCVLCDTVGSVAPVSPCGHLVCRACFDGSDYSACPICHRRLSTDDPFVRVNEPASRPIPGAPLRLRVIAGRPDKLADAREMRDALVCRLAPLSDSERSDLAVLVEATTEPGDLAWLPEALPARQTLAFVTGIALAAAPTEALAATTTAAAGRWTTATDVARTLWVLAGGGPGLALSPKADAIADLDPSELWRPTAEPRVTVTRVRVPAIARPLRRAVLGAFERFDLMNAVEDVLRHQTVWKRLGERLHPFEHASACPAAAVCFAVLRQSAHPLDSAVGRAITAAAERGLVEAVVDGSQVRARPLTFASRIEALLANGDYAGALDLLRSRPGDFVRRLDHLARLTPPEGFAALTEAVAQAGAAASASLILTAYASLAERDKATPAEAASRRSRVTAHQGEVSQGWDNLSAGLASRAERRAAERDPNVARRVFFPRGNLMRATSAPDRRPLLPPGGPDRLRASLAAALLGRAEGLDRFDVAVLDSSLAGYPLPGRTQTAAGADRAIPRGAAIPLPDGETIRLFLHWTENPGGPRVDLDLSVVFFDDNWSAIGHCDYTDLRPRAGATHSGDLTSAPPPRGATEFIDLDIDTLAAGGVTHVGVVVFSFSDVPFETLTDAFAGFSVPTSEALFDPARVALRFDLEGDSRIVVPMTFHLADRTLRWLDVHLDSKGYGHNVDRYREAIAHAGADLELAYGTGRRPTLLDLAAVHAATRAAEIWVRHPDGTGTAVGTTGTEGFEEIRSAAAKPTAGAAMPFLSDRRTLFVATGRLPEGVQAAAPGSVLVAATGQDPLANATVTDLIDTL